MRRARRLVWLIPLVCLCLCGLPIYLFFYHCPVSSEFVEARRNITIGMSFREALKHMPGKPVARPAVSAKDDTRKFTGELFSFEVSSIQCENYLRVTFRNGSVVKVELTQYNDLDHTTHRVE